MLGRNMAPKQPDHSLPYSPVQLLAELAQRSAARCKRCLGGAGCSERPFARPQRLPPFRKPP